MQTTSTISTPQPVGSDFDNLVCKFVRAHFMLTCGNVTPPPQLFTTDAIGLYDRFVEALPSELRQHHNCRACRTFVERFGGLVYLVDGEAFSPFWSELHIPEPFTAGISAMRQGATSAKINGVFYSVEAELGQSVTGEWRHFAVTLPEAMRFRAPSGRHTDRAELASQAAAVKREEFGMLVRALADYTPEVVSQAIALLDTETLYRSEKVIGVARWLANVQVQLTATKNGRRKEHILWAAVASAPTGYAHARSSMIGTLLDDLAAGVPVDEVKRKFAAKMHPLQYQRPTAAPSVGNVREAEKVVAELGAAGSLKRRFAKLEDLRPLWVPCTPAGNPAGKVVEGGAVFAHLLVKPVSKPTDIDATSSPMTWEKFARTVLAQGADSIELNAPAHGNYMALIAAEDPSAPPIIQWDSEQDRNTLTWYVYHGGSASSAWRVSHGWVSLTAITLKPSMYKPGFEHQGVGVMFIITGARDTRHTASGGLFVEQLRSQFHGIRSTLEAYFKSAPISGRDEATACGLMCSKGGPWDVRLRVTKGSIRTIYKVDRWD